MSKITNKRKVTYYIGMGMMILGFILFISVFFTTANMMTSDPFSTNYGSFARSFMLRPIIGMILIVVGAIVMNIGARGAAGSGIVLDPEQAREDLRPFNEAKGDMINDVISNIDVVDSITSFQNNQSAPKEIIKIKCRNCNSLNDEDARYCKECGRQL